MGNCFSMDRENLPVVEVAPNTFVLKLVTYCRCKGCKEKLIEVEELLRPIQGVHSTSIDANAAGQVTISGTVDAQQVIWLLKRKAGLSLEEIPSMKKDHELMQMKTLPVVDQENLLEKALRISDNEGGLKELEITLKATFNGKNKDGMSGLTSDTYKKIVVDDDDSDRGPKSQGHFPPPEPVAGYEPSAPPWPYGYPYVWSS